MFNLIVYFIFNILLKYRKVYYAVRHFDYAPIGLVIYDTTTEKYLSANPYFLEKLGFSSEREFLNTDWKKCVHPDYKQDTLEKSKAVWKKNFLGLYINAWVNQKTGDKVFIQWTAFRLSKNEVLGCSIFIDDVHGFKAEDTRSS